MWQRLLAVGLMGLAGYGVYQLLNKENDEGTVFSSKDNLEVFNLKGTSKNKATCCGSWIAHHKKHAPKSKNCCSVKGCSGVAEVGAHVQLERKDNRWWIVPMCKGCNKRDDETLELNKGVYLVSANISKTCG